MKYEELFIRRIAKPLKMSDSCITLSDEQKKRLAPPYNKALELDKNWDIPTLAGAGGIRSTADDMLKFLQASVAKDKKPVPDAIHLAFEKRHTMDDGLAIGLGWHIARDGITRWHNGMTGGYSSWMAVVPQFNAAVVVLSNTATNATTVVGEELTRVACGIKVEPPKERKEIALDAKELKPYLGDYAITPNFVMSVTEEGGKLMVQATGQSKLPMFAESKTKFFLRVVDAQITFVRGKDGKVNELVLHQGGLDQRAKRVK
jgi:CubicO group peptidase (beta-lactamase class C family)